MYRKAKLCLVGLFAVVFVTVSFLPPTTILVPTPGKHFIWDPYAQPKFAIASWNYPDEYGQGIHAFRLYENSTASWEPAWFCSGGWGGSVLHDDGAFGDIYNWNASLFMKIRLWTPMNKTLTGATSIADGKNYLRHNITVTDNAGSIVFSKQNFTYSTCESGEGGPIYWYVYEVILNFLPLFGETYTVTITYEVYYLGDWTFTADPPWLTGYNCRQSHVIIASAGAGTDYQVSLNVTRTGGTSSGAICYVGTNCQSDFDDIRFTDNDGTTLLDYWREGYTSTTAKFWIEVKDNLNSTSATIYIYYGNSSVSTTSNGPYTFWFFDDFETGAFGRWDYAGSYWSVESSIVKRGTYAAYGDAGATAAYRFLNVSRPTVVYGVMLHMWVRVATAASAMVLGSFSKNTYNKYSYTTAYNTATVGFGTYNGAAWQSYCKFPAINTWYETNCGWDRSNSSYEFYVDGSKGAERAATFADTTAFNGFSHLFSWTANTAGWDHWLDDVWIRKWVPSEPAHSTWGSQEDARTWNQAADAVVVHFIIDIDVVALNGIFILAGLILIPASTLYLVNGGKDSIDSRKIFVFFIVFLFGWALFLGVINP